MMLPGAFASAGEIFGGERTTPNGCETAHGRAGLPTIDLDSARPEFVVACDDGEVIEAGALQRFGPAALLRSVAVAPAKRGHGSGDFQGVRTTEEFRSLCPVSAVCMSKVL